MLSDHFVQQNCFVPLQKCDADIPVCKGSISPSIKRTQFPLMLSWACTINTVQGLSLEFQVMINFLVWENLKHHQSKLMFLLCKSMRESLKILFLKILKRYKSHIILLQFFY